MTGGTRPERFGLRKLAHFPAAFVALIALGVCAPALDGREIPVPVVAGILAAAAILEVLTLVSALIADDNGLSVRFFSLRWKRVTWDRLARAEYGMSLVSLALGITLTEKDGRRARLQFGYWADEDRLLALVTPRILEARPDMDAETAQIVALVTGTPPRRPTLRRVPWLERRRSQARSSQQRTPTGTIAPLLAYLVAAAVVVIGLVGRGANPIGAAAAFAVGGLAGLITPSGAAGQSRGGLAALFVTMVAPFVALAVAIGPASTTYVLGFVGTLLVLKAAGRRH